VKTGWFIGFAMAFILLTLLCTVGEMKWIGAEGTPLIIALNPFKYGASAWTTSLLDILLFRYTFFEGSWILVRWILLLPVSAGFVIGLSVALAQGILSAFGGLFRAIRPM